MLKKVLVVDDDREMLRTLKNALEKYNGTFSMLTAQDGVIAADLLKQHQVFLVVTELEIPRMDGIALLNLLWDDYPDVPAIIITGSSTSEKKKLAQEKGVEGYFEKPFIVEDLARKINATLKKQTDGGILHGVGPGTFLQIAEMEQKTCTIRLTDDKSGIQGVLFFKEGELIDARTGALRGREAAYKVLGLEQATIAIQESCSLKENKIQADHRALLIEAMRLKDEEESAREEAVPQDEVGEYIVSETVKKEPEILMEEEEPKIAIEEEKPSRTLRIKTEGKTVPRSKAEREKIYHSPQATPTEGEAITYRLTDNILSTLSNFKEFIVQSSAFGYLFKLVGLFSITLLMALSYLFFTMESNTDIMRQINEVKARIQANQETLYQIDEEIQQLYTTKEDSIRQNDSQVKILELDLKISELQEKQENIRTQTEIHQKALEECQIRLEEIKRKSFFKRLLDRVEGYLPEKS